MTEVICDNTLKTICDVLTAKTRCDRSQSEAAVIVVRVGASDLAFCAHHYREHVHGLAKAGAEHITAREDFDTDSGFLAAVQPGASEPVPVQSDHSYTAEAL